MFSAGSVTSMELYIQLQEHALIAGGGNALSEECAVIIIFCGNYFHSIDYFLIELNIFL